MAPSRMIDEQRELIESLISENARLHQQIDEMTDNHRHSTISYLHNIGICFTVSNRNFRISMILSILLIIETIYILWVM